MADDPDELGEEVLIGKGLVDFSRCSRSCTASAIPAR